ncbi:MAG: EF-hand domain-containing protein [Maricaulaceae bacterium]|nr:EF-hand domain-containing protein [Maricaulaceae bacterium]
MRKIMLTSVAALFGAAAAHATPFEEADANGDGVVTFEELRMVNPDVTAEEFNAADLSGDGMLSRDEYDAAFGPDSGDAFGERDREWGDPWRGDQQTRDRWDDPDDPTTGDDWGDETERPAPDPWRDGPDR